MAKSIQNKRDVLNMPVKRELGEKAVSHLKDMLSYDNLICQCLAANIEILERNVFAYFPEELDVKNIEDYKLGGVLNRADNHLASYILNKYNNSRNCVAIFDDVMASPADDFLEKYKESLFSWDKEVYHYVDLANSSEESLSKLIWATGVSWHFVCVILETKQKLTKEDFSKDFNCEYVVENMKELVIGAFDGEGFIHSTVTSGSNLSGHRS